MASGRTPERTRLRLFQVLAVGLALVQVVRGIGRLDDPEPGWASVSFAIAAGLLVLTAQMERRRRALPDD